MNLLDVLGSLNPELMVDMTAEPGWVWAGCPTCRELRYLRRPDIGSRCILTPKCEGRLEASVELVCVVCGKPVSRARIGKDLDYCTKKCETS